MGARVHILVSGVVQGVFYRASTQQKAKELGLVGWVRNLTDGRVEILVEGEEEQVKELVAWAHRGPTYAQVSDVVELWSEATGEFVDFAIEKTRAPT